MINIDDDRSGYGDVYWKLSEATDRSSSMLSILWHVGGATDANVDDSMMNETSFSSNSIRPSIPIKRIDRCSSSSTHATICLS